MYRLSVTGTIELGLAPFIERGIEEARAAGARAVILDIDTPGGRVDAAERISDAIEDAGLPVYALVNRRAFSAGALIAMATARVYMRPGSVIGAATPVDGSGHKASEKIVSAMRSEMRALAEAHGLDPVVAEAMVDEDVAIEGVVEAGKLLTLTTEEAVDLGYAREVEDLDGLLDDVGLAGATVVDIGSTGRSASCGSSRTRSWRRSSCRWASSACSRRSGPRPSGWPASPGLLALALFFGSHLHRGARRPRGRDPLRGRDWSCWAWRSS